MNTTSKEALGDEIFATLRKMKGLQEEMKVMATKAKNENWSPEECITKLKPIQEEIDKVGQEFKEMQEKLQKLQQENN